MEICFLGTGTSTGVPMLAFDNAKVDLEDRRNWRTRTSLYVTLGEHHILVDAAFELRLQCLANDIQALDTFILTHEHADHILGMEDLRRFCAQREPRTPLPVHSTERGAQRVREIFPYAITDVPPYKTYPWFDPVLMPSCLEVPGGRIRSVRLPHGRTEVLGLIFEEDQSGARLAYYTDCEAVPEEAEALARDADALILVGLREEPHPTHLNFEQAREVAARIGARQTWLTHISYPVNHADYEQGFPGGIRLAYDGLRLSL